MLLVHYLILLAVIISMISNLLLIIRFCWAAGMLSEETKWHLLINLDLNNSFKIHHLRRKSFCILGCDFRRQVQKALFWKRTQLRLGEVIV